MRSKLQLASGIAVAATFLTALIGAAGSGAAAEEANMIIQRDAAATQFISEPVVQPLPDKPATPDKALSLAGLTAAQSQPGELSRELHCLAGAIYFEARGEPLNGQLAVARVIVGRAASGRFPGSYCGVVFQPSQFSFARGTRMPAIRQASRDWREAVAIARIADAGSWQSPVEGALYFHASHVSPGWRHKRMARIGNHIFYR